jgi:hypothetical protein
MSFFKCKHLRQVVILAGVLLIAGMFLEVIAHLFSASLNLLLVQPIALGMVLASPVVVLVAVVLSLIPGLSLKDCSQQ